MSKENITRIYTGTVSNIRPEFVSLPARGGDPICGLSRSFWYSAEKSGKIRLNHLRKAGSVKRGRTLLPVQQAIDLVNRLAAETARRAARGRVAA